MESLKETKSTKKIFFTN